MATPTPTQPPAEVWVPLHEWPLACTPSFTAVAGAGTPTAVANLWALPCASAACTAELRLGGPACASTYLTAVPAVGNPCAGGTAGPFAPYSSACEWPLSSGASTHGAATTRFHVAAVLCCPAQFQDWTFSCATDAGAHAGAMPGCAASPTGAPVLPALVAVSGALAVGAATLAAYGGAVAAPAAHVHRAIVAVAAATVTAYCAVPDCADVLSSGGGGSGGGGGVVDAHTSIGTLGIAFPSVVIGLVVTLGISLVRTWMRRRRR